MPPGQPGRQQQRHRENLMIRMLARFLARPAVADWLIRRAMRTPYFHITSADGRDVYMERYWLFNPYPPKSDGAGRRWGDWLPSIRLHRIMREDQDRDLHDHPWNARTFILHGWYQEERLLPIRMSDDCTSTLLIKRQPGDTARLNFGQYHRITQVSNGGVWTLFVTGRKRGTWGFLVQGVKIQWRTYLGIDA
jgi:hypothetical protein